MAVTSNFYTDISSIPNDDFMSGWTSNGLGGRATRIISGERQFFRDDLDVSNRQCFLIEAALSTSPPPPPGIEAGARLQVRFDDPDVPNPFEPQKTMRCVQVRLLQDADGTNRRFALVDGNSDLTKQEIPLDWTVGVPLYRVRLMRQNVAGTDSIVMAVEPSSDWDPTGTISVVEDFSSFSAEQPLAGFTAEYRFGNFLGLGSNSIWQSVHVSACDNNETALPYWPGLPTTQVSHNDPGLNTGDNQQVDFEVDTTGINYLANDQMTLRLTTEQDGELSEQIIPPSNTVYHDTSNFVALHDSQNVVANVSVEDASGRTRPTAAESCTDSASIPDRTSPSIDSASVNAARFSRNTGHDQLTLIVTCTDLDPGLVASASIGGQDLGVAVSHNVVGTTHTFIFSYDVGSSPLGDGDYAVAVVATDTQGNSATDSNAASVEFDFSGPAISSVVADAPLYSRQPGHDQVTVTFDCDDASAVVGATLAGQPMVMGAYQATSPNYTCTYDVASTGLSGGVSHQVQITATDAVGNQSTNNSVAVMFDLVAPTLSNVVTDALAYSRQPGFNTVTLTFDCGDPAATVQATIGGQPMSVGSYQPTSPNFTCTYDVAASPLSDGMHSIQIVATDAVANENINNSAAVDFDFTGPILANIGTNALAFSKQPGFDQLVLTFDCSDSGATVVVTVGGQLMSMGSFQPSTPNYTCTYDVSATPLLGGNHAVEITATDSLGNTTVDGTSVLFDFAGPGLSNVATDAAVYSRQPGHDTLTVTFDCSDPAATIAVDIDGQPVSLGSYQASSPNYTATYDVAASPLTAGSHTLRITATDALGNQVVHNTTSVQFDFAGPGLSDIATDAAVYSRQVDHNQVILTFDCADPAAAIAVDIDGQPLAVGAFQASSPNFTCTYDVSATPLGVGDHTITITAIDAVGNTTVNSVTTVGFDFAGPLITAVTTNGANFSRQPGFDEVQLSFDCGDPLATVEVTLGSQPMNMGPYQPSSPNYTCTYDVSSSPLSEGNQVIEIVATDGVGNQTTNNSQSVLFDFAGPALSAVVANGALFSRNPGHNQVVLTFDCDDPTAAVGVELGGLPMSVSPYQPTSPNYTCTYDVSTSPLTAGSHNINIVATDALGNASVDNSTQVEFDFAGPQLTAVATDAAVYSKEVGHNQLTLTFNCSDPLATIAATVGGEPLNCGDYAGAPPNFTCTFDVAGTALPGGNHGIVITAVDALGNQTIHNSHSVQFDFAGPELSNVEVNAETFSKQPGHDTLTLTFDCDDAAAVVTVEIGGETVSVGAYQASSPNYTCTYDVAATPLDEGLHNIVITAVDGDDNTTVDNSHNVGFKFSGPGVGNVGTDASVYSQQIGHNLITVTFNCDEPDANVQVSLGGQPMNCGGYQPGTPNYTCTYNLSGSPLGQGPHTIEIVATDGVDNQSYNSSVTVQVKLSPPSISNISTDAAVYSKNVGHNLLVLQFDCDDPSAEPQVTIGGETADCGSYQADSPNFVCTYNVATTPLASGDHTVLIQVEDSVGNSNSDSSQSVAFDFAQPAIGSVAADASTYSKVAGHDQVTVTFDCDDADAEVAVTIGGLPMNCGLYQPGSPNYTCTYDVASTPLAGGDHNILVTATDPLGNSGQDNSVTVAFDFAGPSIENINTNASVYSKEPGHDAVVLTFDCDDPAATPAVTIGGQSMNCGTYQPSSPNFTCTYDVGGTPLTGGDHVIRIEAVDGNDNLTLDTSTTVHFDFSGPALSNLATDAAVYSKQPSFDTVTLTFDCADPTATVIATVAGDSLDVGTYQETSPNFTCTYDVAGTAAAEGAHTIEITATDTFGNETVDDSLVVEFDFSTPVGEILVAPGGAMPETIPAAPLNRFDPAVDFDLHICLRLSATNIDFAGSSVMVSITDAGGTETVDSYPLEDLIYDSSDGEDYYLNNGAVKQTFDQVGFYVVTAKLKDTVGNADEYVFSFTTLYPQFFMYQGYLGKGWNSPDILLDHDEPVADAYAGIGCDPTLGTLQYNMYVGAGQHNYMGIRVHNQGNMDGSCWYRMLCAPAGLFTQLENWRMITSPVDDDGNPVTGQDYTISDIAQGGCKISASRDFNDDHDTFKTIPGFEDVDDDNSLHTCVCAIVHSDADPLLIPDGSGGSTPVDSEQFNDLENFIDNVMAPIVNYSGPGGRYWNQVYNNDKVANINFHVTVAPAESAGAGAGDEEEEAEDGKKKTEGMDEKKQPWKFKAPADAAPGNRAKAHAKKFAYTPWLYDADYGWTPKTQSKDPRPQLQQAQYKRVRMPLHVRGFKDGKRYAIEVNRRNFPQRARLFLTLPTTLLAKSQWSKIFTLAKPRAPWQGTELIGEKEYNYLFGTRYRRTKNRVIVELTKAGVNLLDGLRLSEKTEEIELSYGVLLQTLKPKIPYGLQVSQLVDDKPVGSYDFLLRSYHPYDIPIIGDRRTGLAYRRSSREVAAIPPRALAYFDNWGMALAQGFDFAPRSYQLPPSITKITARTAKKVLALFNNAKSASDMQKILARYYEILKKQKDVKSQKRVMSAKLMQRIFEIRKRMPKKKFTSLKQVQSVPGVGPGYMGDVIAAVLLQKPRQKKADWNPDFALATLLGAGGVLRSKPATKMSTRRKATGVAKGRSVRKRGK